jgi:hypothetical protein
MSNENSTTALLILLLIFLIVVATVGVLVATREPEANSPVTLEATPTPWQGQAQLTTNTPTITWGNLIRGRTYTRTVKLSNTGDATTNPLNMTSTCAIGTLTWNAEGTRINAPADSRNVTFTLQVYKNAPTGNFNFNIKITY